VLRDQLDQQPDRVVVIGAGFIGAEVAAVCRGRGIEVTMLEAADAPLERALGTEMGMVMAALHRDHGVDLRLGVGVDGLDGTDRVEAVRLSDGSRVEASVVLVGIGVSPNTGWVEGAGLNVDDGIVTDATLAAAPGVVAAGDIARWPSTRFGELLRVEHWETAIQMGEAAARRLLADHLEIEPVAFDPVPWFWSDQYDRKIQLAGRSAADDRVEVVIGSLAERRFVALYGRDDHLVGVLGMNRPAHVARLRPLVEAGVSWSDGVARAAEMA
jgi:3-phenylpropionate/trans-cinnamate dioxygenase ferredoxin reductase component